MPPRDSIDIEGTDEEDVIPTYTAHAPKENDTNPIQGPSASKTSRRDYSSSSEDEPEEIPFADPKLLLQSDIDHSAVRGLLRKSRLFQSFIDEFDEDQNEGTNYADPRIFMQCISCMRDHRTCDRRLPFCHRCSSSAECIYPRLAEYKSHQDALDAILGTKSVRLAGPSPGGSNLSNTRQSAEIGMKDTKGTQPLKTILFEDGDVSHSQKKCPAEVLNLIRNHRKDFEDTQLAGIWGREKNVHSERGKDVVHVDEQTDEDVPIARFIYGETKQFFVAWLPAQDASQPLVPVVTKFRVYNNEGNIKRNGRIWRPLRWQVWRPDQAFYHQRDIIRLVATSQTKTTTSVGRLDVIDLDTEPGISRALRKSSSRLHDSDSTEDEIEGDQRRRSKRQKTRDSTSWHTHPKLIREQGPDGRFLSQNCRSAKDNSSAPAPFGRHPREMTSHVIREPQQIGPDLTVIFKNRSGDIKGSFPYHECDTAEKLFDVACVAEIAQIEPPATRLLKVEFHGGGEGRVRPDNVDDFERVFKAELPKLLRSNVGTRKLKVTISPYL